MSGLTSAPYLETRDLPASTSASSLPLCQCCGTVDHRVIEQRWFKTSDSVLDITAWAQASECFHQSLFVNSLPFQPQMQVKAEKKGKTMSTMSKNISGFGDSQQCDCVHVRLIDLSSSSIFTSFFLLFVQSHLLSTIFQTLPRFGLRSFSAAWKRLFMRQQDEKTRAKDERRKQALSHRLTRVALKMKSEQHDRRRTSVFPLTVSAEVEADAFRAVAFANANRQRASTSKWYCSIQNQKQNKQIGHKTVANAFLLKTKQKQNCGVREPKSVFLCFL
ncbi:uncharacterized protein V6R79_003941 [Siganus canaliculatus]